jgi:pimeloyl-ACP methyl ester carboxylesterase
MYLQPLRIWLRRIGYRPIHSGLVFNAGCSDRLARNIERALADQLTSSTERLAFIGHSRGGILGWAIAARLQERASHFIALGSPVGGLLRSLQLPQWDAASLAAARPIVDAGLRARRILDPDCDFPSCDCEFVKALRSGLSPATSVLCIMSSNDQVVPLEAARLEGAKTVEITGTHSGLAFNIEAYKAIAAFLAS